MHAQRLQAQQGQREKQGGRQGAQRAWPTAVHTGSAMHVLGSSCTVLFSSRHATRLFLAWGGIQLDAARQGGHRRDGRAACRGGGGLARAPAEETIMHGRVTCGQQEQAALPVRTEQDLHSGA